MNYKKECLKLVGGLLCLVAFVILGFQHDKWKNNQAEKLFMQKKAVAVLEIDTLVLGEYNAVCTYKLADRSTRYISLKANPKIRKNDTIWYILRPESDEIKRYKIKR